MELHGRPDVCGRRRQSDAPGTTAEWFAPRAGFAWSLTDEDRDRGGYGLYWVPTVGHRRSAIGARGYSASTTFLSSTDGGLTPVGTLQSVPGRHHAAAGQHARPGHRRRQRHRLRRSGREAGLRAAVLARLAARAAGRQRASRRLHGQPVGAPQVWAARGHDGQHQPARSRSTWRWARRCSRRCRIRSSESRRSAT